METRKTVRDESHTHNPTMAAGFTEIENAATNSIEVTRNAKGDYQWSIKRYFRPDEDRADVLDEITKIDEALKRCYQIRAVGE